MDMDGPLKTALDNLESQGVIRRELITYRKRSGQLVRETVYREYSVDGDYIDHCVTTPIGEGRSV